MRVHLPFSRFSKNLRPTSILAVLFLLFAGLSANAQTYCANETSLFMENFGAGNTASSSTDVTNLTYQATGDLNDGFYRIIKNTQQRPEWHASPDHTGNTNGKMLVVNGSAETFYTKTLTNGAIGFPAGNYAASCFLMNINTPGTCSPNPLLPKLTFKTEYSTTTTGENFVQLQSVTKTGLGQTPTPTWFQLGGVFTIPVSALRVRISMNDGEVSGCGNDFAIDDIKFATCPTGAPLPVEFLSVSAVQKGAGVAVNWATASELNNKEFSVERSIDGTNWNSIATVTAKGNSNTQQNYNAYDAKPTAGVNYYRIRQLDTDGNFKFSTVAKVTISIDKASVSVITNPFVNNVTVDFLSTDRQVVSARLTDMSGRAVSKTTWNVNSGSSRQQINNVAGLLPGMYILSVYDQDGVQLFHSKLIKQ